ncbi:hypothetical protein C8R47DRAFT_1327384 [Mycena vitilis]|nr:hypothetical protein C8R47DRAFT_1327384 [Mycena vitilis]
MRLTLLVSTVLSVLYVAALPGALNARAPPLDPQAVIKQCTARGTEILGEIAAAKADAPGISEKYNTLYEPLSEIAPAANSDNTADDIREILQSAALPITGQLQKSVVKRKGLHQKDAYTNYFDVTNGIIVAEGNYNYYFFYDPEGPGSNPANPVRKAEPNALGWNQIVAEQWKLLAHGDMSTIKHILRYNVANEGTRIVIQDLLAKAHPLPKDNNGWTVVSPGQTEYTTLLGTDNGKGGGRMLKDYRASMAGISIKTIRIKEEESLYHMIEDYV